MRCLKCFSIVNPFFRFLENGKKFACNICSEVGFVPEELYSPLGVDGLPIDKDTRPYLTSSVYQFKVSSEYRPNLPQRENTSKKPVAHFLFLLDCSDASVDIGIPLIAMQMVKEWIANLTYAARIGFILINDKVNIVAKQPDSTRPCILALADQPSWENQLPVLADSVMINREDYTDDYLHRLDKMAAGIQSFKSPSASLTTILRALRLSTQ